jgi:O-antigen/teichoic acid export membrane protein
MVRLLWSLTERLLPRLASASLVFILAALTSPSTVGLYAWAMLLTTAFKAVTDQAARQIIIGAITSVPGRTFLRRYRRVVGIGGPFVIIAGLWCIAEFASDAPAGRVFLSLLPVALVPTFTALAITGTGVLQFLDEWRLLALGQLAAAAGALAISLPIILITRSVLGGSIQLAAAEAMTALWVSMRSRPLSSRIMVRDLPFNARSFFNMSLFSAMTWSGAQLDRVLLGAITNTATLGQYSLAVALSRSLGDPLAAGSANVLRAKITDSSARSSAELRAEANSVMSRSVLLAALAVIGTVVVVEFLAAPILGSAWDASIRLVPIMAMSALPATLAWSTAALHVSRGTSIRALVGPVVGIGMALPIALAATYDLVAASWLVVLRDLVVCTLGFWLAREIAPWRSYTLCCCILLVFAASVTITS